MRLKLPLLAAGGVIVSFLITTWVRRGRQPPATYEMGAEDKEYRRRLEQELEEFEEGHR